MFEIALCELVRAIDGHLSQGAMPPLAGEATPVGRIEIDSRRIEPGDVFWALRGRKHDGAHFAHEALARGASGVVHAGPRVEPWAGRWSMEVEDTQQALWQLAAEIRRRFEGRVIAVTGSVGKTATREMIDAALRGHLAGSASPHNYNNHIGVPLSMTRWLSEDDYAVLELGASGRDEIKNLTGLSHPQVGVVTRIGEAHLGEFGSQQAIAESKAELLAGLPRDGWAVLNGDDPQLRRLAVDCRANAIWVGRSAECDVMASHVCSLDGVLAFTAMGRRFEVPVWGRHYLNSALAAIAVGCIMELSVDEIATALAEFKAPAQRCQVTQVAGVTLIDDTYNASPTAMQAALELLRDVDAPGRRIVVCGDMLELGPSAPQWHHRAGEQVVTVCGADVLVACGEHARDVVLGARDAGMPVGRAIACRTPQEALTALMPELSSGDAVMVKGSRALALEKFVEALRSTYTAQAA